MSTSMSFMGSNTLSMGVELELQLINLHNFNLAMEAEDFLRRLSEVPHVGQIKPEITQSMIELNSSVHTSYPSLLAELHSLQTMVASEARKAHIGVCGGGTHPFQKWKQQRIFQTERFASLSEQYGYLAKQFTVFGQHIHIACPSGDDALYLCHAMVPYIPQFIALSAASPFVQGVDTAFDCSRLAVITAFPLSGTPPWLLHWEEFEAFFNKMVDLGIIQNMKDFYWDIRPKPEFGTVELRICDTPLSVDKAAELGAYMQALVCWLLEERPSLSRDIYLTYLMNRFRAARYGFDAMMINPVSHQHTLLADDILQTCDRLTPYATKLNTLEALNKIREATTNRMNGASWLRSCFDHSQTFTDTVRIQTEFWMAEQSDSET